VMKNFWSLHWKHPFSLLEGEKFFLALNGYELEYTQKELLDTILDVAAGHISYEELLNWIIEHQK
jgi:prophage maintenance system killer protein